MKEYKKEILINSKRLSSEDLVRYFKFLHSNAKKLYLRYLTSNSRWSIYLLLPNQRSDFQPYLINSLKY